MQQAAGSATTNDNSTATQAEHKGVTQSPVEGHAALACHHILQVDLGLGQLHLAQGKGCLTRVLKVNTQVRPASLMQQV